MRADSLLSLPSIARLGKKAAARTRGVSKALHSPPADQQSRSHGTLLFEMVYAARSTARPVIGLEAFVVRLHPGHILLAPALPL